MFERIFNSQARQYIEHSIADDERKRFEPLIGTFSNFLDLAYAGEPKRLAVTELQVLTADMFIEISDCWH
jgi:hypothetical protein